MDENGEGDGGGGAPNEPPKEPTNNSSEDLKKEIAELKLQLESLKPKPSDDPDIIERAKKDREEKDKQSNNSRDLEAALKFDLTSKDWLKQNQSLLPKDINDIFETASKEKFENAIDKDRAIKSGIVQTFFSVQTNVDLLTSSQKEKLDDYLKLTKNGKEDKAQKIYNEIFEPTFEMLKRIKKAEALSGGFGSEDGWESEYKNKLMGLSKKHYLGEK
jgi:hypothetical protein